MKPGRGKKAVSKSAMGLLLVCLFLYPAPRFAEARAETNRLNLHKGWSLQSSCKVAEGGEVLSTAAFKPSGWYETEVPTTVVAAQVAAGEFKEPYFGGNIRKLPGMNYPIGDNFANQLMPKDSPYACSWWYRLEFQVPPEVQGKVFWLHFDGINNRANIWLNGRKVANSKEVAGAYRIYEFNVSAFVNRGVTNVLAVETIAPTPNDLGINFVDWNPAPPDKDMGLWRSVYLTASGPVSVRHAQVVTHFPGEPLKRADLTVVTDLLNSSREPVEGILDIRFDDVEIQKRVTLSPGELRSIQLTPEEYAQLRVADPKLWWPAPLGPQNLHPLSLRFRIGNAVSDEKQIRFGIREITAKQEGSTPRPGKMFHLGSGKLVETDLRPLLFRINGQKILIRGAGWTPDMLLRDSEERLRTQLEYVRDMNLNTIRLEGKLESDRFFDLADELGILVMAGWCCCDHWEDWDHWGPNDLSVAKESLRTQVLRLRSHPSLLAWLNGSDFPPPANVERAYIKVLREAGWPNPYISSASAKPTSVTGASGVKMTGPYDYEPPAYWLADTNRFGGAFGFNTETSPGAAIPVKGSLEKMFPGDHLWPLDDVWTLHAGAGDQNGSLQQYNDAMDAVYGKPTGLDDYLTKSQAMAYDGERAMFEAYARNKYSSTGVIQWMLNNAWPSVIWHLYDYFLHPAGGYFGAKKACEPLHVQFSYDDRGVVVVNSFYRNVPDLTVKAALYDFDLHRLFDGEAKVDAAPDSVNRALTVPVISPSPKVMFLKLTLEDDKGEPVSSNFYWLSNKASTYDWDDTLHHGFYTGISTYEDLTDLARLPRVRLDVSASVEQGDTGEVVRVRLRNPSDALAFQVHLGVREQGRGEEILPVFWSDNYVCLMPGESRSVIARYATPQALAATAELAIDGWNVEPSILTLNSRGAPQ